MNITISDWVFPSNVFMGLMMPVGEKRQVSAQWENKGTTLRVDEKFLVRGSQGEVPIIATHRFVHSPEQELLLYSLQRSTRTSGPDMKYVLKRAGTRNAFFARLRGCASRGELPDGSHCAVR